MKYFKLILICFIWSTTWAVIKIGLDQTPLMVGLALRFSVATIALGIIILLKRRRIAFDRVSVQNYLVVGLEAVYVSSGGCGVVVRKNSAYSLNYRITYTIGTNGTQMVLGRNYNTGTFTTLQAVNYTFTDGKAHRLKCVTEGDNFKCYIDGNATPAIDYTDDNLLKTETRMMLWL